MDKVLLRQRRREQDSASAVTRQHRPRGLDLEDVPKYSVFTLYSPFRW
jgi:hypothetical protein